MDTKKELKEGTGKSGQRWYYGPDLPEMISSSYHSLILALHRCIAN
jgi:hypothetical protein